MTITEMLQVADQLVFSQTGKHLDDLQKKVIKGVWQGHTYDKIGDECNRSEGRVRDIGYKLWDVLSQELGEEIDKFNFRSSFERLQLTSSQYINGINGINIHSISDFTFCSFPCEFVKNLEKDRDNQQLFYHNLKQAPRLIKFDGRNEELSKLNQLLKDEQINLISVTGITGIGKTNLVRNLVEINQDSFNIIIWKNLKLGQSFNSIIKEIEIEKSGIFKIPDFCGFLELLREQKCLIILDSFEEIFTSQKLTGNYKNEYQDYKQFLQMITEIEHQSKVILISQEKLELNRQFTYGLELSGLDQSATEILEKSNLKNEDRWQELINLYQGNPLFLQEISIFIQEIFNGNVEQFLQENSLIFTTEIEFRLKQIWLKLAKIEQEIVLEISKYDDFISIAHLKDNLSYSWSELGKAIKSLNQRYLLIFKEGDHSKFNLCLIFKEFVKEKSNTNP